MVMPNPVPTAESGPKILEDASWFDGNWPFISTFLCPAAFLLPFLLSKSRFCGALRNPYVLGWLSVAFYLCHHTEEHAYDLRGWRYAFVPSFNYKLGPILFKECDKISHITCPLDARMATYINVIVIWIGFVVTMLVAHYLRGRYAFAGLCNWGMSVVNAFGGHLMPWLFQGYNPGAFQSLFMFAFGVFAITRPSVQFAAACVLNGVLFHVIAFFVGMNLVFKYHFPAEVVALLGFLCSTAMPLGFARLCAPDDPDDYEKMSSDSEDEEGTP
ncbi:Hypothetical protein (Fragment) [Durusdinium trenchii]|uniref:Derlin n=1 Tax=Durusdinium trenchii TaxID=1381693 RepID=A0ABP0IIK8_9DINO